jgi:DNA-binding CsgD family transcriptional regulator
MPVLSASDAERLLRFVADAESIGGDYAFTPDLLVELGKLIAADWLVYSELDRVRKRELFYATRPGEEEDDDAGYGDDYWDGLYWKISEDHPNCCARHYGKLGATKLSDFMTLSELRRSRIYELWFRPLEVERELVVPIPSPLWHTKALIFARAKGPDFTERDRLVLNRLQPHLSRLWEAARTRRVLRLALGEIDGAAEHQGRGFVLLSPGGMVEFASPPAQRLLQEFFPPVAPGRLPRALAEWLETGSDAAFIRPHDDRRLVVRRTGDSLLLEERVDEVALTAREREVLSWVARGKTNSEIAQMLWLAPSTVRKHLENVYAKLGVSTRTAAVARFFGLSDEQAS